MAQRPTVRWNEKAGRWMAWVRFPDGSRRKVERVDKADAQHDLDELLALRAQSLDPGPRRTRQATFNEVIDAWFEDGCPNVAPTKKLPPRPDQVAEHGRQRPPAPRHQRPPGDRPALGRSHVDRAAGEAVRRHGRAGLRHQHDRPQLELPQPGAASTASATGRSRPTRRPTCCSPRSGRAEDPQEPHHRAGEAPARRDHPRRPPPGDVADRPHVRPAPGRAGRPAVAVRRHRLRLAEHPRRRAGPRGRGPLRRPGRAQDAAQQAPHRPAPAARRRPPPAPRRHAGARPLRRRGLRLLHPQRHADDDVEPAPGVPAALCTAPASARTGRPTSCATPSCPSSPTSSTTW